MKALIGGKYLDTYIKDNSIAPDDKKKIEFLLASDDFSIPGLLAQAAPLVMKYGPIVANWLGTRMSDQLKQREKKSVDVHANTLIRLIMPMES